MRRRPFGPSQLQPNQLRGDLLIQLSRIKFGGSLYIAASTYNMLKILKSLN